MTTVDAYKTLSSAIIGQAITDLEDPHYQEDAYFFLNNEWGHTLLMFSAHGLSRIKLWEEISSIIRTSSLHKYDVIRYARNHTALETAEYFEVSEEDIHNYGKRHCIHFKEV